MIDINSTEYRVIHKFILYRYGRAPLCIWDDSHTGRFEWANVTGVYTKELDNYLPMCVSCHRKFDYTEQMRDEFRSRIVGNHYAPRVKVAQYKDGQLIMVHESINQASIITNNSAGNISECVSGKRSHAGGYQWLRLHNDYTML